MGEEPLADPMAGAALSEVARTFQEALVPPIAPSIGGLDCLTRYRPGDRRMLVGGDFMDVIEAPQGGVAWVVGDVAGHGPVAAAMGVGLRASWRTVVCGRSEPDEWLDRMEAVFESLPRSSELFVTLCTGLIAPDLASAVVLSAGHPPPILLLDTTHSWGDAARARDLGFDEQQGLPLLLGDQCSDPSASCRTPGAGSQATLF